MYHSLTLKVNTKPKYFDACSFDACVWTVLWNGCLTFYIKDLFNSITYAQTKTTTCSRVDKSVV